MVVAIGPRVPRKRSTADLSSRMLPARVFSVLAAALMSAGVVLTPLAARPLFAAESSDDPMADQAVAQAAAPLTAIAPTQVRLMLTINKQQPAYAWTKIAMSILMLCK